MRLRGFDSIRAKAVLAIAMPLVILGAISCGDTDPATPAACLGGPPGFRAALADAPGPVRLDGEVAISDCLPRNQGAGPQESVGRSLLLVASGFARQRDRGDRAEAAALRDGYLVGAVRRAAEDSEGIHSALVDRITSAAESGLGREPAQVRQAYERGRAAGLEDG